MFNYYEKLWYFSSFGTITGLFTYALFFARAWLFYKKGTQYASKATQFPKLSEVQYIFLALGISGPILAGLFPFLGAIALLISTVLFVKTLSDISSLNDSSIIKPEKMTAIGIGMGLAGTFGFILGAYKSLEERKYSGNNSEKSTTHCEIE